MQKTTQGFEFENLKKKTINFPILLVITAYLLLDFAPKLTSIDVAGIQWLILSLLNVSIGYYIYTFSKNTAVFELHKIQFNSVLILYTLHFILSGMAIFYADNTSEALLQFIHLSLIICFIYLLTLLGQLKGDFLTLLATIISIVAFIQSFIVFSSFIGKVKTLNPDEVYNLLTQNSGNINIFAAQQALKIPFILLGIYQFKGLKKAFFGATYFFTTSVLFFTLARTSIISTVVISVLFIFLTFFKNSNKINALIITICLLISYGLMTRYIEYLPKKAVYETLSQNNNNNDVTSGRINLWKNTLEIIKRNPIIGTGLGSYKIEAIPYEGKQRDKWSISKYAHNDFLQTASETGILNGVLYLSLFIIIAYQSGKVLIFTKDNHQYSLSFVVFSSIFIFGFDSALNFPKMRLMTLIHFAIILTLYFSLFKEYKTKYKLTSKYLIVGIMLLSALTIYPNYLYFKTVKIQNELLLDEKKLELTYDYVNNNIPCFPNLTELGYPLAFIKARYLEKENKTNEVLKVCYESLKNKENNKIMANQSILAGLYNKLNKPDSSLKYWNQCINNYPLYEPFYANYLAQLAKKKDTTAMVTFINKNLKLNYPPKFIYVASKFLLDAQYPLHSLNNLLKTDIEKNSNDSLVRVINNLIKQNLTTKNKPIINQNKEVELLNRLKKINPENWVEIIKLYKQLDQINPKNYIYAENIGVSYFRTAQYKKAIPYLKKVIDSKTFKNGKSEYIIAACYHYIKNKNKACQYAHQSLNNGYKDAQEIINKNCK